MDKSRENHQNKIEPYMDSTSLEKQHYCFFILTTEIKDNEEDEKYNSKSYEDYKKRHPQDGCAVWNNFLGGKQYIYFKGDEKIKPLTLNGPIGALEEEIMLVLHFLHSDEAKEKKCNKLFDYDYAWIKLAIDQRLFNGCDRLYFNTMSNFRDFIHRLEYTDICKEETLHKYYNAVSGTYPNYVYSDNKGRTNSERIRRNTFIKVFVEKMREIRGVP